MKLFVGANLGPEITSALVSLGHEHVGHINSPVHFYRGARQLFGRPKQDVGFRHERGDGMNVASDDGFEGVLDQVASFKSLFPQVANRTEEECPGTAGGIEQLAEKGG